MEIRFYGNDNFTFATDGIRIVCILGPYGDNCDVVAGLPCDVEDVTDLASLDDWEAAEEALLPKG